MSIPEGVHAVNAIEMLMLTWAGIKETSQLLIGTGYLKNISSEMMLNIAEDLGSVSVEFVLEYSYIYLKQGERLIALT